MVKAPENFMENYLSHEKGLSGKKGSTLSQPRVLAVSAKKMKRLKKNMQIIWGVFGTAEIKEIISKKEKVRFFDLRSSLANLNLSYVTKGILVEYEVDMGIQKDLAGARIYKQSETLMSRYFYTEKGAEELLKSTNTVYKAFVDILSINDIEENDIWDAVAKGKSIKLSSGY